MNWKTFVETTQAKTYVLPPGWDSRDTVAEQLQCSPDAAGRLLSPAVKAGTIETQLFPVWDTVTRRLTRVTAYRKIQQKAAK